MRALLVLAAPLVLQNFVQVIQQIVDTFWLGRLGEDAVAAVGMNFPIIAFLFAIFFGINVGTQVLVSQRVGADDEPAARRAMFHGVTLALVCGLVLAALVYLLAPSALALFGVGPQVTALAVVYLTVYSFGFAIMGMSDAVEMGFIGWGDSRAALYINIVAVGINVVLDPFLIFGYYIPGFSGWGVRGAALATVLGYTVALLFALALLQRNRNGYTLTRDAMTIRWEDYRELVDVGAPMFGQNAASQSVRILIIGVVTVAGGSTAVAAYTVGARVASVAFIPASGLMQAAQSVIGQNIGADNPLRASRATWMGAGVGVAGLTAIGIVQWFIPGTLATLFVPDLTPAGFDLTVDYLRILTYGYWAIGATYLFKAGFNGARRTKTSMIADMLKYWGIRLPIAAFGVLLFDVGPHAVFWAVTVSNVIGAVGIGAYYYYSTNNGMLERATDVVSNPAD